MKTEIWQKSGLDVGVKFVMFNSLFDVKLMENWCQILFFVLNPNKIEIWRCQYLQMSVTFLESFFFW